MRRSLLRNIVSEKQAQPNKQTHESLGSIIYTCIFVSFVITLLSLFLLKAFALKTFFQLFLINTVAAVVLRFILPVSKVNDNIAAKSENPESGSVTSLKALILTIIYVPVMAFMCYGITNSFSTSDAEARYNEIQQEVLEIQEQARYSGASLDDISDEEKAHVESLINEMNALESSVTDDSSMTSALTRVMVIDCIVGFIMLAVFVPAFSNASRMVKEQENLSDKKTES